MDGSIASSLCIQRGIDSTGMYRRARIISNAPIAIDLTQSSSILRFLCKLTHSNYRTINLSAHLSSICICPTPSNSYRPQSSYAYLTDLVTTTNTLAPELFYNWSIAFHLSAAQERASLLHPARVGSRYPLFCVSRVSPWYLGPLFASKTFVVVSWLVGH